MSKNPKKALWYVYNSSNNNLNFLLKKIKFKTIIMKKT